MVEGTRLESVRTLKRTAGSNPALSAKRNNTNRFLKMGSSYFFLMDIWMLDCNVIFKLATYESYYEK